MTTAERCANVTVCLEEAARLGHATYYGDATSADYFAADWERVAKALRDHFAAHTGPASGGVTLVQALRISADHLDSLLEWDQEASAWATGTMREEAEHLEAEQATRESDIRIGRRLGHLTSWPLWEEPQKFPDDHYWAIAGKAAREAVDAERGQE